MASVFQGLNDCELEKIRSLGKAVTYPANVKIFAEGDEADYLYFLKSGKVSIYIDKFNTRDEVKIVEEGGWFGEMAMFNGNRRNANAITLEETEFLSISNDDFSDLMSLEPEMKNSIMLFVEQRNIDLVFKEKLIDEDCMWGKDFHISIKGDPSLRESAMTRVRYESIVDKNLPELISCIEDLLLNRSVHRVLIGFNNGEIRLSTLLDPFSEEFHPAARLLDKSYIQRHFPLVDFDKKTNIILQLYQNIQESSLFSSLPNHLDQGMRLYYPNWKPVPKERLKESLSKIPLLRNMPNFYVRNLTLGILKDAIHMQFNCDGTHIVSSSGFKRFIEENL